MDREVVIADVVRTAIGKGKQEGALSGWHPADLLAHTLETVVGRSGLDPASIDDVIVGCVSQAGEQAFNIGRSAVLGAGFPELVPATTIDRQCGSSQQAVHFAAQGILSGAYDVAIAAGVEIMSRVPMFSSAMGKSWTGRRFEERYGQVIIHQGLGAEMIAAKWGLTRTQLDEFSVDSHRKAAAANDNDRLSSEIIPVPTDRGGGPDGSVFAKDEGVRPDSSVETLARLKPAFYSEEAARVYPQINWVVTAGGSSQISDGASAAILAERQVAIRLGLPVRATLREFAVVGDDPVLMLTGVIPATKKLLARAGLSIDDVDAFEVNEAFAPVVLAWQREVKANPDKTNMFGGAIANGHPLGASGTKLLATLVNVLERTGGRYGLQTICEGGGMANAMLIERAA
jgi:acetyl-CoA acyltransferase